MTMTETIAEPTSTKPEGAPYEALESAARRFGETPASLALRYGISSRQLAVWNKSQRIPEWLYVALLDYLERRHRERAITINGTIKEGIARTTMEAVISTVMDDVSIS